MFPRWCSLSLIPCVGFSFPYEKLFTYDTFPLSLEKNMVWNKLTHHYKRQATSLVNQQDLFNKVIFMGQADGLRAYLTVPLVFFRTVAANSWVTPTRLIPSTSTIWSFTCILKIQKTVITKRGFQSIYTLTDKKYSSLNSAGNIPNLKMSGKQMHWDYFL